MAEKFNRLTEKLKEGRVADKHPASNLMALPGLLESVTRQLNDDAGELAQRLNAVLAKKDTQMERGRSHVSTLETKVKAIEDFNDRMESAMGGNGDPTSGPESSSA